MNSSILARIPPWSQESEEALCAACILDPTNIDKVSSCVDASDFYDAAMKILFGDLTMLHEAGKSIWDTSALTTELRTLGHWESIGGGATLGRILDHARASNAVYYAKQIRKTSLLRRQIMIGTDMIQEAHDPGADPDDISAQAHAKLLDVFDAGDDTIERSDRVAMSVLDELDKPEDARRGIYTGLFMYDRIEGPWMPGEMIVVAARPSIGKTALAMQIAQHNARKGRSVLFVSLEMSGKELVGRMVCAIAGLDSTIARDGRLNNAQRGQMIEAATSLSELPFYTWSPRRRRDFARIAAKCRLSKAQNGLDLVVVDYLQNVEPENKRDNRQEQVAVISRKLKGLAGDLDVPLVAIASLNRKSDEDDKTKPRLSHLRDSGQVEYDADTVILLHRQTRNSLSGQLIIAKHRFGKTGEINVTWDPIRQTFTTDDSCEVDRGPQQQYIEEGF